jgi:hypothetical protein
MPKNMGYHWPSQLQGNPHACHHAQPYIPSCVKGMHCLTCLSVACCRRSDLPVHSRGTRVKTSHHKCPVCIGFCGEVVLLLGWLQRPVEVEVELKLEVSCVSPSYSADSSSS